MQFNNGDRVRTKARHFPGTVQGFLGSRVLVAFDDSPGRVVECSVNKIEKIEESRPTDSIQVDNIVNHPPHYTGFSNGAEVIDITENLPFNRGNAIKYLARAGKKNPDRELEDLKKALWFVAREIERLEKSEKKEEK